MGTGKKILLGIGIAIGAYWLVGTLIFDFMPDGNFDKTVKAWTSIGKPKITQAHQLIIGSKSLKIQH